jgi:NAD(P)H-hydrate epimerase
MRAWPLEILTTAEMAAADRRAVASGRSIDALMRRAGAAVAARAVLRATPGAAIAVLCGPGNNGGDGYVAAAILQRHGFAVAVFAARSPSDGPAARAAAGVVTHELADFDAARFAIVIDALYGAGLSRPITGAAAQAIERVNAASATVIAVDVPSGLSGDSGQPVGVCTEATETATFFRLKPGHLLWPGRALCGAITVADIGLDAADLPESAGTLTLNQPSVWRGAIPRPAQNAHKYQRGHCVVVSGPEFKTGAARLAATAALNAGAGAVTIIGDPAALRVHASHVTAIMLDPAPSPGETAHWIAERTPSAAVIGPAAGVGTATRERVRELLAAGVPTVLDADALTSLAGHLDSLNTRPHAGSPLVLTPHAGEFQRLFPDLSADRTQSKVEQARAAARLVQGVVVFKGIDTVIASADGRAAITLNAGPELATAGSGDVLAGLIAANLAQGMPAFEAAAAGVWLHGELGRQIGLGLTADRLAASVVPLARWVQEAGVG